MYTDEMKLKQCVLNLLSNAVKFTQKGEISLLVARETVDGSDWLVLHVKDTGIGMTPDQIKRVFEGFAQADASTTRKYGGTGLGLAISQKLCQMMGGELTVESELGVGSTFTLRLPTRVIEQEKASIVPIQKPSTVNQATPLERRLNTILAIDDESIMLDIITRFLTREGFNVVTATSGQQGLDMAKKLCPIAIILDVMMPDLDGWSILTLLKNTPEVAGIPVIMLTIVDDKNRGYMLGASDYLVKPVNRDNLAKILEKYKSDCVAGQVLIVEDAPEIREMMRRMLEKEGWTVTEAVNGRTGLGRVAKNLPDIIVLDLVMPEMDGFTFINELRQTEAWSNLPVVVVTAKDLTKAERLQLNGSVEKILQKGALDRDELLHEVLNAVKSCALSRDRRDDTDS